MRRLQKLALSLSSGLALLVAIEACRSPTQMTLDVTYGGSCKDLDTVAIIVGTDPTTSESRIATNLFTTTTAQCGPGGTPSRVGTLVVTPSDNSGQGSVVVLASFDKPVEQCKASDGYFGCIVARRIFSFVAHTSLTLEIPLDPDCKNVPCDAVSTCKKGACIDAHVACTADGCPPVGQLSDGGTLLVDAPTSPEAAVALQDGSVVVTPDAGVDSSLVADAGPEAGTDASSSCGSGTSVGCGGATCNGFEICCSNMSSMPDAGPGCTAPAACMSGYSTRLECTATNNCQAGKVCCLQYNYASHCLDPGMCDETQSYNKRLCNNACECAGGGGMDAGARTCTLNDPNGVVGVRACE